MFVYAYLMCFEIQLQRRLEYSTNVKCTILSQSTKCIMVTEFYHDLRYAPRPSGGGVIDNGKTDL